MHARSFLYLLCIYIQLVGNQQIQQAVEKLAVLSSITVQTYYQPYDADEPQPDTEVNLTIHNILHINSPVLYTAINWLDSTKPAVIHLYEIDNISLQILLLPTAAYTLNCQLFRALVENNYDSKQDTLITIQRIVNVLIAADFLQIPSSKFFARISPLLVESLYRYCERETIHDSYSVYKKIARYLYSRSHYVPSVQTNTRTIPTQKKFVPLTTRKQISLLRQAQKLELLQKNKLVYKKHLPW